VFGIASSLRLAGQGAELLLDASALGGAMRCCGGREQVPMKVSKRRSQAGIVTPAANLPSFESTNLGETDE
jgi:hypothetical protein